jgi:glycosyltransferase involved in cell wall biosynthesis
VTSENADAAVGGFTVIIPTKEEQGYIRRSLSGIRAAQDDVGFSVEIIVVDGGSTDATVREAEELADRVVTDSVLASRSIAHARNVGACLASHPFQLHTDADVVIPDLPGLLQRAADVFCDASAVAVTAPVMPYPWESTRRDYVIHRIANAFFRSSLWYGALFSRGECQIVRASAFATVGGYDGSLISGEDCDLFRRLNRTGRIVYLADQCVYHSTRRFRGWGYLRTFAVYLREGLWFALFRRSYIREWTILR